jgi:cAMP-dependent protein kinase regulator
LTIADALEEIIFQAGEEVVKQGDQGNKFYMIIQGQADVTQHVALDEEEKLVGRLGPRSVWSILTRTVTARLK